MSKFFFSYRRQDSADVAGRLHDRLENHFGRGAFLSTSTPFPSGSISAKSLATRSTSARSCWP